MTYCLGKYVNTKYMCISILTLALQVIQIENEPNNRQKNAKNNEVTDAGRYCQAFIPLIRI